VHEQLVPQVTVGTQVSLQVAAHALEPQLRSESRHAWLALPQVSAHSPVAEQLMVALRHALFPVQLMSHA